MNMPLPITDEDLLLWSWGELDEPRAREVRAALAADAALACRAAELNVAVDAVRAEMTPPNQPDPEFNQRLRQRWQAELSAHRPAPRSTRRYWPWISIPTGLAAMLALATMLLWPGGDGRSPGVAPLAWADVVRAVAQIQHFHALVFQDDPRRADPDKRMFRIDLYHQAPDQWRAHGFDQVSFFTDGKPKDFYVGPRTEDGAPPRLRPLIPPEFRKQWKNDGLLSGVLWTLFNGRIPPGEPVKSDQVSAGEGIEVFDYAHDASERWARIWVLRESRLPLRLHVYEPASDAFTLVEFDYSDPQPSAFFDPASFEREWNKQRGSTGVRAYSIGMRPVTTATTKPRNSSQIHETTGGYRAPIIKRLTSNAEGDVVLVTDSPRNLTPGGNSPHEQGYQNVTDNWGNRYLSCGGYTPCCGENVDERRGLIPLPPFKQGPGVRKLSLEFHLYDGTQDRILARQTVDVPPARQPSDKPSDRNDWQHVTATDKRQVLTSYYENNASLPAQLEIIRANLRANPDSLDDLLWQVRLLRKHGREAAAWRLFEAKVRDRLLPNDGPLPYGSGLEPIMGQYLVHLAHAGRQDDLHAITARLEAIRTRDLAAQDPAIRQSASYWFNSDHSLLARALRLPETLKATEQGVTVRKVLVDKNGYICVQMQAPPEPAGWEYYGQSGSSYGPERSFLMNHGWYWDAQPATEGWSSKVRMVNAKTGQFWLVLRGQGSRVTLGGRLRVLRDNYGEGHADNALERPWTTTLEIPAPNIDNLEQWWHKNTANLNAELWFHDDPAQTQPGKPTDNSEPKPVTLWQTAAQQAYADGQWTQARQLFQQIIAAGDELWPQWYLDPRNTSLKSNLRWDYRARAAACAGGAGDLATAQRELAQLREQLLAQPDYGNEEDTIRRCNLITYQVRIARQLWKDGRREAAQQLLRQLESQRPNMLDVPTRMRMIDDGRGNRHGWYPRGRVQDAWRGFDTLWWDIQEPPPPATP